MTDERNYIFRTDLMDGAALQDSLLQSYRGFQLTLQSILIAVATGLSIAVYSFDDHISVFVFATVHLVLTVIGIFALFSLRNIILARGRDVNWWHRAIIKNELQRPPNQRPFTQFKLHQQLRRSRQDHIQKVLSMSAVAREEAEEISESLVSSGLGHTRRRTDNWLSWSLLFLWVTLITVSMGRVLTILL